MTAPTRRGRRPPGWLNRAVLAVLRSPLHRLLDPGMCELRYRGRRTGRTIALPVLYATHRTQIVVLVGDPAGKRWWRNFTTPAPVQVRRGRDVRSGSGRIVAPDHPAYQAAWQAYTDRQHVGHDPTDRLLVIDTAP